MKNIILSFLFILLLSSTPSFALEEIQRIVVYKAERRMELLNKNEKTIKAYKIALGDQPRGHKTQEGDEKTPEGIYKISGRNQKSSFHLSLRISYPNAQDIAQTKKRGVSPGGDIMIHGIKNGFGWIGSLHRLHDTWTDGCIAVTNDEIEEIWNLVPNGTIVDIRP